MKVRLASFWEKLRASYWFVPAILLVSALAAAVGGVMLDRTVQEEEIVLPAFFYTGGPEGARGVLSSVVTAMMSVTSVVFSITVVVLTLASNQFGPRLLRNFMKDTPSQVTLGVFVATFLYALLVLRTIREDGDDFVPQISVTFALALTVASTAVLVYFIHHVAEQIQADEVIGAVNRELRSSINRLMPEPRDEVETDPDSGDPTHGWPEGMDRTADVTLKKGSYIQGIDYESVLQLAAENNLWIKFLRSPGDYVPDGGRVAEVYSTTEPEAGRKLMRSVITGGHRTPTQDVEFGVLQLVEVAVRSLSPGINDPFTAMACIDRLGSALRLVAERKEPPLLLYDKEGKPRVVCKVIEFPELLDAALGQIRRNAKGSPEVLCRLVLALCDIAEHAKTSQQKQAILAQGNLVAAMSRREIVDREDREAISRALSELETLLGRPYPRPPLSGPARSNEKGRERFAD